MPHNVRLIASTYTTRRDPCGAIGWAFQLYRCPCSWWNANFDRLTWAFCRMFNVMTACCAIWSHNCSGHSMSVVHSPLTKWFLKVWMACLAALTWWLCGLTNCQRYPSDFRHALSGGAAWLSVTLNVGLWPLSVSSVKICRRPLWFFYLLRLQLVQQKCNLCRNHIQ